MESLERLETINQRLIDYFGVDTTSDRAIWRVVWSDDQYEKQLIYHTREGLELITPIWEERPKYPYIKERFILERLVLVPIPNLSEMTDVVSYEPMWTFSDKNNNPLPPKWEAIKHIIDVVYSAIGKHNTTVKYRDPDSGKTTKDIIQEHRDRIAKIQMDLFGNETDVTDALGLKEGISVPTNYVKES